MPCIAQKESLVGGSVFSFVLYLLCGGLVMIAKFSLKLGGFDVDVRLGCPM